MSGIHFDQRANTPDSLDEFLAQLLTNIPDLLPSSVTAPTFPYPSGSISAPTTVPYYTTGPFFTCQWVSSSNPPAICGAPLSQDTKLACEHFRCAHDVRGNEKVHVYCRWHDCGVPPMLRGSLVRHILTVHLGLMKWQCEVCGRVFSRRGTAHACVGDE